MQKKEIYHIAQTSWCINAKFVMKGVHEQLFVRNEWPSGQPVDLVTRNGNARLDFSLSLKYYQQNSQDLKRMEILQLLNINSHILRQRDIPLLFCLIWADVKDGLLDWNSSTVQLLEHIQATPTDPSQTIQAAECCLKHACWCAMHVQCWRIRSDHCEIWPARHPGQGM